MLEKAAAIKRFEYIPLGELVLQKNIIKNLSLIKMKEKQKSKISRAKSNLVYNNDFAFYKYHDIKDVTAKRSPDSKINYVKDFKDELEEF